MCDCYEHPCAVNGCKNTIPWHIGDYKFSRDCFAIWCPEHEREAPSYSRYFNIQEDDDECRYKSGDIVSVVGPELGLGAPNADNTLNIGAAIVIVRRMPAEWTRHDRHPD